MLTDSLAFAVGLARADALLRRRLDTGLGSVHGIGYTDYMILFEIDLVQGGRLRSVDLARRLLLTASGVTRALLPLEKIGLVRRERHERDARASYVRLTPAGKQRLDEATPSVEQIVEATFGSALSPAARLTMLGFFERFGYDASLRKIGGSRNESKSS